MGQSEHQRLPRDTNEWGESRARTSANVDGSEARQAMP